jgi:hypothetical protein
LHIALWPNDLRSAAAACRLIFSKRDWDPTGAPLLDHHFDAESRKSHTAAAMAATPLLSSAPVPALPAPKESLRVRIRNLRCVGARTMCRGESVACLDDFLQQHGRMTTLTFKVSDADAQVLRRKARAAKTSLSELLRQRVLPRETVAGKVRLSRCRLTGAEIFAPVAGQAALTTQTVRELLADFP